jgi:hypothetical protein
VLAPRRRTILLDSTKVRREISRLYDKDPRDWRVLVGKDRFGFYDVLISHGPEAWQVKEYQVNPYKFVGLGSKLPGASLHTLGTSDYPFGLRSIGLDDMKELAGIMDDPRALSDLASKLLDQKPVSSRDATQGTAILQGPVLQSSGPLEAISTAHTKLDEKLRRELQRLVRRDFRHTLTPYL